MEREKVTWMLSIFPEILVSYFLIPLPPHTGAVKTLL